MADNTFHLKIESESKHLEAMREGLRTFLTDRGFTDKSLESILVAMGEACTNAMRHSYGNAPGKIIDIKAEDLGDRVTFTVCDEGETIDLSKIKKPELPPTKGGGLGLYFMETIMDEMKYNQDLSEGNELVMMKYKDKDKGEN